jgi:hypothetical protein
MANKEIDIDNHRKSRSKKKIENSLIGGKRFDEIEQSDFANYQEYSDYLKNFKVKKKKLVDLQRSIEGD